MLAFGSLLPVAVLQFAAPVLAWGALACAIPVLVHLLLRPRSRQQVLPTLRFLIRAHRSANRSHRLRRFLLLACRMALLALLALLLMRPAYHPDAPAAGAGPAHPAATPVSAVLAFDNSASMGYRFQGRTRLAWAIEAARSLLTDLRRFPPGSQIAVLSGPPSVAPPTWMDPAASIGAFARLSAGDHDLGVARLLQTAYPLLPSSRHAVREVYLFGDLTRHAWTGLLPSAPAELSGLYVVDVGQADSPNVSLRRLRVPARTVPSSRPAEVGVSIVANGTSWKGQLSVEIDGRLRATREVPALEPQVQQELIVTIPAMDRGVHRLALRLAPRDALSADDERFAVISAGALPHIVVLADDPDDEAAILVRALIAPPSAPEAERRFAVTTIAAPAWNGTSSPETSLLILADVSALTQPQWQSLELFVRGGGTLIVIPGAHTTATALAIANNVLPAPILGTEALDPPMGLAATDLTHPYLKPFADEDTDSINARRAFRRLRVGPLLAGSRIIAPFVDGQPALLERSVARGRAILLTFSPQREWGQFGTQAGPMLVLLQTILGELSPRPQDIGSYLVGQSVSMSLPPPQPSELFLIGPTRTTRIAIRSDRIAIPTAQAGVFQLSRDSGANSALITYGVDVPEGESDLQRIPEQELIGRLPPGRARIVRDIQELRAGGEIGSSVHQYMVPLALLLLGLLTIESLFANRFYAKRPIPARA